MYAYVIFQCTFQFISSIRGLVCSFDITMSPTLYGANIAYLYVPSNDTLRPVLYVRLRGMGQCFYGDANEDGRVDILDAILSLRVVLQLSEPPVEMCKVDVDESSIVDVRDVIRILKSSVAVSP